MWGPSTEAWHKERPGAILSSPKKGHLHHGLAMGGGVALGFGAQEMGLVIRLMTGGSKNRLSDQNMSDQNANHWFAMTSVAIRCSDVGRTASYSAGDTAETEQGVSRGSFMGLE